MLINNNFNRNFLCLTVCMWFLCLEQPNGFLLFLKAFYSAMDRVDVSTNSWQKYSSKVVNNCFLEQFEKRDSCIVIGLLFMLNVIQT